ncbi:MAG: hypothetical protein JKX94_12065 [Sneathiella sp.]|nr:hypothetical protein [Sneathiella sp.]
MSKIFKKPVLAIVSLFLFASCAADGGTGNPLIRPLQYFSYMNGDDIRKSCENGSTSHYRLIYNALYEEQVRTYDIRQDFNRKIGEQETRVFSRGIGSQVDVSVGGLDFKSNFRSVEPLSYDDLVAIDRALVSSKFERPTINGQILHSDEFYWVGMVCRNGNFKYYAWSQKETDIKNLPFLKVLSKGDTTGAYVQEFKIPVIYGRGGRANHGQGRGNSGYFSLEVGDNALKL